MKVGILGLMVACLVGCDDAPLAGAPPASGGALPGASAAPAGGAAVAVVPTQLGAVPPVVIDAETKVVPSAKLAALGIKVQQLTTPLQTDWHSENNPASQQPSTDALVAAYLPLLEEELGLYPPGFIKTMRVSQVVIGQGLVISGVTRAGAYSWPSGLLIFDTDSDPGAANHYTRHVIHHEFLHYIDQSMGVGLERAKWDDLIPAGTTYGKGGATMQDAENGQLLDDLPGFVTKYATASIAEDKAEIWGCIVGEPDYLAKRVVADPLIAAKVARIKETMAALDPAMDAAFFARLEAHARQVAIADDEAFTAFMTGNAGGAGEAGDEGEDE